MDPNAVQHLNLKVFIQNPEAIHLADAIPVFHRWIRDSVCPEMLVDVADYRHVPAGPGVLLIGHQANYSFDNREDRLGLLYNRKAVLDGTFQDRLAQAFEALKNAGDRLENEPVFASNLRFDWNAIEVFVNDRLLAPNSDETWQELKPEIEKFFGGYGVTHEGERRDLFRVLVTK